MRLVPSILEGSVNTAVFAMPESKVNNEPVARFGIGEDNRAIIRLVIISESRIGIPSSITIHTYLTTHANAHKHKHAFTNMTTSPCPHIHTHRHVRTHARTHTHAHARTRTHTHAHTRTHARQLNFTLNMKVRGEIPRWRSLLIFMNTFRRERMG